MRIGVCTTTRHKRAADPSFDSLFLPKEVEFTYVGICLFIYLLHSLSQGPYWQWLLLRRSCEGKQGTVSNLPSVRSNMMFLLTALKILIGTIPPLSAGISSGVNKVVLAVLLERMRRKPARWQRMH